MNEPERKPALTVVVQSWATPLIGLLMLVLGLAAGYFVRPYFEDTQPQAAATAAPTSVAVESGQPDATAAATADPTQVAQSQEELMAFLIEQTKHFKGDENAPVTIIEFSDFQ
jgi:hypothetical protein